MRAATNTVIFRVALSLSIVWAAVVSVWTYREYNSIPLARFLYQDDDRFVNCSTVADLMEGVEKPRTAADKAACQAAAAEAEFDEARRQYEAARDTALGNGVERLVVPIFWLLLIAAYFDAIIAGVSAGGRAYGRWLKGEPKA